MARPERGSWLWRDRAACIDADTDLFFRGVTSAQPLGPEVPPREAEEICNRCPVRPECLWDALVSGDLGVRGGVTGYQRQLLSKRGARATCPGCGARFLVARVPSEDGQVCLACGVSWPTRARPRTGGEKRTVG